MPPVIIYVYGVNETRLFIHSLVLLFVAATQFRHIFILENIQKLVFTHRQSNITNIVYHMYTNMPYEDCRCNVVSIESCLTDLQLKYTRILPLILFVLEIYILKDILSLKYYRKDFLRNLYWITAIFLLFYLLIIIYRSSRDYSLMAFLLSYSGMLLYFCCAASKVIS